ncbi:TPA: nitrogen fixation protein NifHD [Candidatus Sumerlaeota bacterium]|jgi:nitrogen regulatory protein PII 2|nr:nitrogen fixation protein NifHD [Candidatus Sumerlaeota bacterium]
MKEIIAIIRPKKVGATKEALEKLGFPSLTAVSVIGRGRQRGIAAEMGYDFDLHPELLGQGKSGGMKYIPKRMLTVVVSNEEVDQVVDTIIKVNQTAQIGDGKIFVCPLDNAVRVRTDESGNEALV